MKDNHYNRNNRNHNTYDRTHNIPNSYDSGSHKIDTFLAVIKAVSVLGAAYYSYKKRDTIQSGLTTAKDNIQSGLTTAKDKTVELGTKISDSVKETTSALSNPLTNPLQDYSAAFTSFTKQVEDKYQELQGEDKQKFVEALKELNKKINGISSANTFAVNSDKSHSAANGTGAAH